MKSIRSAIALAMSLIMALAVMVFIAQPASATYSAKCHGRSIHYQVRDGSPNTRVAYIDWSAEICETGKALSVATHASIDGDTTGPGTWAGFVMKLGGVSRYRFIPGSYYHTGYADFRSNDTLKTCSFGVHVACGYTEDFQTQLHITFHTRANSQPWPPKYLRNPHNIWLSNGRYITVRWAHKCTNSVCGVRLSQ